MVLAFAEAYLPCKGDCIRQPAIKKSTKAPKDGMIEHARDKRGEKPEE